MALEKDKLKSLLEESFNTIFKPAFTTAYKNTFPNPDDKAVAKLADEFGEDVTTLLASPLADALSAAIHTYIKTAEIKGNIFLNGVNTIGSPTAQRQLVPITIPVNTYAQTPYAIQAPLALTQAVAGKSSAVLLID